MSGELVEDHQVFSISPAYFTTSCFTLFQVPSSDRHQLDEAPGSNKPDLDGLVPVANVKSRIPTYCEVSYSWPTETRGKQILHPQALSGQVSHALFQAKWLPGERKWMVLPNDSNEESCRLTPSLSAKQSDPGSSPCNALFVISGSPAHVGLVWVPYPGLAHLVTPSPLSCASQMINKCQAGSSHVTNHGRCAQEANKHV